MPKRPARFDDRLIPANYERIAEQHFVTSEEPAAIIDSLHLLYLQQVRPEPVRERDEEIT